MSVNDLTNAMLEQLQVYIQTRDETGWYYGNKEQFERRHQALIRWIETEISQRQRTKNAVITKQSKQ